MKILFFHIKSQVFPLCAAIVLFFMLLNVSGVADTVVRKDGTIVTGTITQRNQAGVTIDIGVTEFFVPSSDIKSVSYSGQQYTLDDAEDALALGEPLKALRIIVDIASRDTTVSQQAGILFRKAYLAAHNALTSALGKEEHERVAREAEEMLTLLRTFSQFSGFPETERFLKETGDINARACLALAKNSLRAYKYSATEEYLLKAKATVDDASERSSEILYYLAVTYQGMKESHKTQQVLAELETAPGADKYELPLLPIRNWVNEAMRAPAPPISVTPTPTPTISPVRTPYRRVRITPTPSPAPPPELRPPSSSAPWYDKLWYKVRTTGIYKSAKTNYDALAPGERIFLLLLIPLFIIVWWVIPYQIVKIFSNRDSILASQYRISVKKAGLIMFIIFLFHGLFTKIFKGGFKLKFKKTKRRCPFCNKGIDDVDDYSDFNFLVCPHCQESITPVYDLKDYIDHLIRTLQKDLSRKRKRKRGEDVLVEKDAMLKLLRAIVTLAFRRRSSDIHIEPEMDNTKVRCRIDGVLYDTLNLPRTLGLPIVSAIKVMAKMDITERRIPQDGKVELWIDKTDLDLRISTTPSTRGESVVIRILDSDSIKVPPEKLGLDTENIRKYRTAIHRPHGIIFVTGPSGSGKSTTLYVALQELNAGDKNIITIEDPVEYSIKGTSQMQVNLAQNFTFATGLRSIVRQDPDIIMVGEIRDEETADIAIDAAITGHLVFSTIHTIDAPSVFRRLNDLGVEPRRFSSALIMVIAQRLLRVNCPECKKPYKPNRQDIEELGLTHTAKDIVFVKGAGCPECNQTGYCGRIGIFEIIMPDDELRELLEKNPPTSTIRETARKKGMKTLREEGIIKVMQGLSPVEEVIRVTT